MATFRDGNRSTEITGTEASDLIKAGGGDDTVFSLAGPDNADGGSGDDTLFGGDGADTLKGGTGRDFLDGGFGLDVLRGGAGGDVVVSFLDADRLFGDRGGDELTLFRGGSMEGGTGADKLFADLGNDGATTTTTDMVGGRGGDLFEVQAHADGVTSYAAAHDIRFLEGDKLSLWADLTGDGSIVIGQRDVFSDLAGEDGLLQAGDVGSLGSVAATADPDVMAITVLDDTVFLRSDVSTIDLSMIG
jgi:Ca2+-binding RTX toxin-like protein